MSRKFVIVMTHHCYKHSYFRNEILALCTTGAGYQTDNIQFGFVCIRFSVIKPVNGSTILILVCIELLIFLFAIVFIANPSWN
jgi:hypothetical protein